MKNFFSSVIFQELTAMDFPTAIGPTDAFSVLTKEVTHGGLATLNRKRNYSGANGISNHLFGSELMKKKNSRTFL